MYSPVAVTTRNEELFTPVATGSMRIGGSSDQ
jgi:hypothetical protein